VVSEGTTWCSYSCYVEAGKAVFKWLVWALLRDAPILNSLKPNQNHLKHTHYVFMGG